MLLKSEEADKMQEALDEAFACPPTAEALLYRILLLQKKIRRAGTIER